MGNKEGKLNKKLNKIMSVREQLLIMISVTAVFTLFLRSFFPSTFLVIIIIIFMLLFKLDQWKENKLIKKNMNREKLESNLEVLETHRRWGNPKEVDLKQIVSDILKAILEENDKQNRNNIN